MNYTSDATFCRVIPLVVKSEGGYVHDPYDPGGPTKFGVSWNNNADYLKRNCAMAHPTDIQNLTLDQAKQLYFDRYWITSNGSGITSPALAYFHLDTAVNCGVSTAKGMLADIGHSYNISGAAGANLGYFRGLLLGYVALRLRYYTHDCSKTLQARYLPGWDNRIADVIDNALALT